MVFLTHKDALVTDPDKQRITDPVIRRHISRAGADPDRSRLKYEYSKEFPLSRMYQIEDENSKLHGAHVVDFGGLQMVNHAGHRCDPRWYRASGGVYCGGNNQFDITVEGTRVYLGFRVDQRDGNKAGDQVTWDPRLLVGGVEIPCTAGPLVMDDPGNSFYKDNILEFLYGDICRRQIRLIEGRFKERWIFEKNPGGNVCIEHRFSGNGVPPRIGGGRQNGPEPIGALVQGDREIVLLEALAAAKYPVELFAENTYYTGTGDSVDGQLTFNGGTWDWSTMHDAATGSATYTGYEYAYAYIRSKTSTNKWHAMHRTGLVWDTSGLPPECTIVEATISLYGHTKIDQFETGMPDLGICSFSPASDTNLMVGDYGEFGSSQLADAVSFGSFTTYGYNDWDLYSAGLNFINKDDSSRFGARLGDVDIDNNPPDWEYNKEMFFITWMSEKGSGYKPKLVVTYTEGGEADGKIGKAGNIEGEDAGKIGHIDTDDAGKIGMI